MSTDSQTLLDELSRKPTDAALRERTARSLEQDGKEAEAIALLTSSLRNLTAHEPPPLPCLCKRCLDPARTTAEAFGFAFTRDYAVAEGRVLFFWVPGELRLRGKGVRRSVQTALEDKLRKKKR